MNNPNITDCGHSCELGISSAEYSLTHTTSDCLPCIDEWLHRDQICPFCRHAITLASLLALPPDETYVEPPETPDVTEHRSAKVKELVKYLKVFDAKDKTLVFSQFTSFLNIVAGALKEEGITHCRFDGTMSAKKVSIAFVTLRSRLTPETETRGHCAVPATGDGAEQIPHAESDAHLAHVRRRGTKLDSGLECLPRESVLELNLGRCLTLCSAIRGGSRLSKLR